MFGKATTREAYSLDASPLHMRARFLFIPKEIPLSEPELSAVRIVGARSGGRDARVTRKCTPAARESRPEGNRSSATDGGLAEGWAVGRRPLGNSGDP